MQRCCFLQTPSTVKSGLTADSDMTPDHLVISSCVNSEEPIEVISLDGTVDILNESQDVAVGTQKPAHTISSGLEIDSEPTEATAAETKADAGETEAGDGSCFATNNTLTTDNPIPTQDLLETSQVREGFINF